MCRRNKVGRPKPTAYTDGDRFLSCIEVEEAGQPTCDDELVELSLEASDHAHAAIGVEELWPGLLHGYLQKGHPRYYIFSTFSSFGMG
jgi:hypothetical protein